MQLTSALHRNSIFVFSAFFALVIWGFWNSYYSDPVAMGALGSSVSLVHLHGAGMTLWCLMLVSQAYLIRSNRRSLHRLVGRSSVVLVPFLSSCRYWSFITRREPALRFWMASVRSLTLVRYSSLSYWGALRCLPASTLWPSTGVVTRPFTVA